MPAFLDPQSGAGGRESPIRNVLTAVSVSTCVFQSSTQYMLFNLSIITDSQTSIQGREVQAFGRKVTATAATLIQPLGDSITDHYQNAMTDISGELRKPSIQHRMLSFAQQTPTALVRSRLSTTEIQHRALTFIPTDLLCAIPDTESQYSLFQGFQASIPNPKYGRQAAKKDGQKQITDSDVDSNTSSMEKLTREREGLAHQLELFSIRKNMASSEIREIDAKIANLSSMRNIVLERLAKLEQEEAQLEHECMYMYTVYVITC